MKKNRFTLFAFFIMTLFTFIIFDFYQLTMTKQELYQIVDQLNREIMQIHDISSETEMHLNEEQVYITKKEYIDEKWLRYTLTKKPKTYSIIASFYSIEVTELVWTSYI